MRSVIQALLLGLCGILLGGIVHIAAILLAPQYGDHDSFSDIATTNRNGIFEVIDHEKIVAGNLPGADAYFTHGLCQFSISDRPIRIRAQINAPFWSLAIFDNQGTNRYSVNDRVAEDGRLNIRLLTPLQRAQLRENEETAAPQTGVDVPITFQAGYILVRVFTEDNFSRIRVADQLKTATCHGNEEEDRSQSPPQNLNSSGS